MIDDILLRYLRADFGFAKKEHLDESLRCTPKEEKVVEMRVNRTSKFNRVPEK
jgi:hypothetical protein